MTDYIILSLIMFVAGFVDCLAGGGGIIRLPAFLSFGVPPEFVLGTNKLTSVMGAAVSAWQFRPNIKISKGLIWQLSIIAFVFAAFGALLSRLVPPENLKFLILIIIPLSAFFVISSKHFGQKSMRLKVGVKKSISYARKIAAFGALYDGFLGPGTGTFFAVFFSKYCGFSLLASTGLTKVLNFSSNLFALIVFLALGAVKIKLALAMGFFSILGSAFGVYIGKKKGAKIIRPLIIVVCIFITLKFLLGK
ncbi:MAG: TSUP family transporter [Elusimicrobiaceae bacterium]|nr:TSUP family transporter [Elusimicrobiaceae bacterium]